MAASRRERTGVLVRMPEALKGALVREVARRGGNLNDVATGILAERFGVAWQPTGRRRPLAGTSGTALLRIPPALKREIQAEAFRRETNTNDVIIRTLADALGVPLTSPHHRRRSVPFGGRRGKDTMASTNGSTNGGRPQDKVRVAVIGVGNRANALLQGVHYYAEAPDDQFV